MSKLCRWLAAILVFAIFLICVACGTETEQSIPEVEITPETSTPTEPSIPEISIPSTSTPEFEVEPEETLPPEPEGPSAEELFWQKCAAECPVATEIWLQMKSYGWTDAACAGIMGNIMRETGGDTLKYIRSNIYNKSKSHYGLCQWAKRYYPDIQPTDTWTPSTAEQVEFLRYTILNQKALYHNYGFTEEYLLTATDYREVAKKFCDGYERPAENSTRRENNAEKAWRYFVLGEEI